MVAATPIHPLAPNVWALLRLVTRYAHPELEVSTIRHHFGSTTPLIKELVSKGLITAREAKHEQMLTLTASGKLWYEYQKEMDK